MENGLGDDTDRAATAGEARWMVREPSEKSVRPRMLGAAPPQAKGLDAHAARSDRRRVSVRLYAVAWRAPRPDRFPRRLIRLRTLPGDSPSIPRVSTVSRRRPFLPAR